MLWKRGLLHVHCQALNCMSGLGGGQGTGCVQTEDRARSVRAQSRPSVRPTEYLPHHPVSEGGRLSGIREVNTSLVTPPPALPPRSSRQQGMVFPLFGDVEGGEGAAHS